MLFSFTKISKAITIFPIALTQFVISNNYFYCQDYIYHQASGTAMDIQMVPSYVNLFTGQLELDYLNSSLRNSESGFGSQMTSSWYGPIGQTPYLNSPKPWTPHTPHSVHMEPLLNQHHIPYVDLHLKSSLINNQSTSNLLTPYNTSTYPLASTNYNPILT